MSTDDDSWDWVVPPDETSAAARYRGNDLSDSISVGGRVRTLRLAAGLSEQDLEDYAGVRKSDLLAVEAGLLLLDAAMAEQLAMVLGVTANEILGK